MREIIVTNDLGEAIKFQFNEKTSEIYILADETPNWVEKLPPEETARLQNWFLSL